jgi:hypothetical protein
MPGPKRAVNIGQTILFCIFSVANLNEQYIDAINNPYEIMYAIWSSP